ncbi:MAG: DUF2971 domain-containing protein [Verrucomicrobia bacterium]|nr:DUF2971 domain-containing protein [Verrucomicrobiota bacterium]
MEHGLNGRLSNADATLRLVCFSSDQTRSEEEILLWSHYADKHRGHRIGFKIPSSPTNVYRIDSVTYSPDRVRADYIGDPEDSTFCSAMFMSIGTKNVIWRYENEYRLTTTPERCKPDKVKGRDELFVRCSRGGFN